MTESEERIKEIDARLEVLGDPPVKEPEHKKLTLYLRVSIVQTVFVLIALVGLVLAVVRVENNRVKTCEYSNELRKDIGGVLFDSSLQNPQARDRIAVQISRFALVDCKHPDNPRIALTPEMVILTNELPTTSTSTQRKP